MIHISFCISQVNMLKPKDFSTSTCKSLKNIYKISGLVTCIEGIDFVAWLKLNSNLISQAGRKGIFVT